MLPALIFISKLLASESVSVSNSCLTVTPLEFQGAINNPPKSGEINLVYLPAGGEPKLDLTEESADLITGWFYLRQGSSLESNAIIAGVGSKVNPKSFDSLDWLSVPRKK